MSGCSGSASPVAVNVALIPCSADQRCARSRSASSSDAPSSASGRDASTDRRASVRLSRASRSALSTWPRPVGGSAGGLLGRLELRHDAGQAVRDGVVDLARHARPLVEHARLARLRHQLLLQAAVLLRARPRVPRAAPAAAR